MAAEDFNRRAQHEAGSRERHHGKETEAEEEPPGIIIGGVRYCAEAKHKTISNQRQANGEDNSQDPVERIAQGLAKVLTWSQTKHQFTEQGPFVVGFFVDV